MSVGTSMTVQKVGNGIVCTLDTGGTIYFDNLAFACSLANAILRLALFGENLERILIAPDACLVAIPQETITADDFADGEAGTGEPPC